MRKRKFQDLRDNFKTRPFDPQVIECTPEFEFEFISSPQIILTQKLLENIISATCISDTGRERTLKRFTKYQ